MILVFGGTSDSITICEELNRCGFSDGYILSVATDYGRKIAENRVNKVHMGRMDTVQMKKFITDNNIEFIIDATHPYASDVSANAMKSAKDCDIGYIRYERKSLLNEVNYEKCIVVDSIEEACEEICRRNMDNIFIGTGSKNLSIYAERLSGKNMYVRVLPVSDVIRECESLRFSADNIIAMRGPFGKYMNIETFRKYNVDVLVTKESGVEGGFIEKIDSCIELDIPVIVIKRSNINYTSVTDDVKYAVEKAVRKI